MFKGTIIKNSLSNRDILSKVKILNTYRADDWILHDVLLDENIITELSRYIDSGPWYIHVWKPGTDEVTVIFKDKIFKIDYKDKSTWIDAITYGISIGIPREQLDFVLK